MTAFDLRAVAADLCEAALAAVDPAAAVRRGFRVVAGRLEVGGRSFALERFRDIWLVGAGKAAVAMAAPVVDLLGERLRGGVVVTKDGHVVRELSGKVHVLEASHPLPDVRALAAAREMATLLAEVGPDDLVVLLLSGGGSALSTLPADDITLAELADTTDALLRSGATIAELNAVRKHLERLKGGGLARLVRGATLVTLAIADVVGDEPSVIASGPSVADPSTFEQALAVLDRHGLRARLPRSVVGRLERGLAGTVPETPKAGDPAFLRAVYALVANNALAAEAAVEKARALGFDALLLTTRLQGEAREVGRVVAALAREVSAADRPVKRPGCLVLGGETTVTVRGPGRGGRNQELALGAALELEGVPSTLVTAFGTDGTDGPTDAAGAMATGDTLVRSRALGLDAARHLAENDAYGFFAPLGDLVLTGPTGTNVSDLVFVLVA
jgi:hydroxypyruvate reductase